MELLNQQKDNQHHKIQFKEGDNGMLDAKVELQFDRNEIKQYIHQKLDEEIRETLILVDTKRLANMLSMSERHLESEFLSDPRVRQHEVRKRKKKWFWYKPTIEAITEIINTEW